MLCIIIYVHKGIKKVLICTAGKWNETACRNSELLKQHQQKSLDEVLDERMRL